MRKEERSELIHDALGMLDDDIIEEADRLRGHVAETVAEREEHIMVSKGQQESGKGWKKPIRWRRWTALAASICLLLIGSWAWEFFSNSVENESDGMNRTEAETENDMENVVEDVLPLDSNNSEKTDGMEAETEAEEQDTPSNMEETLTEESDVNVEVGEGMLDALGDKFHLIDNYIKVSILPAKAWHNNGNDYSQAVAIREEYREDMEILVRNMCEASCVKTENLEQSDMDMVYHIFFERSDGEIIHCWLLEDGYLYYDALEDICVKLDKEVYETIFKIFAMHW